MSNQINIVSGKDEHPLPKKGDVISVWKWNRWEIGKVIEVCDELFRPRFITLELFGAMTGTTSSFCLKNNGLWCHMWFKNNVRDETETFS